MKKMTKMTIAGLAASVMIAIALMCTACVPTNKWEVTLEYDDTRGAILIYPLTDDFIYNEGDVIQVTVSAKKGYKATAVYLDGELKEQQFEFMIMSNVTIRVEFDPINEDEE